MAFQKKESTRSQMIENKNEESKVEVQAKEVQTSYFNNEQEEQDDILSILEDLPKVDFKMASPIVNDELFMVRLKNKIKKLNFANLTHEESIERSTAVLQLGEKYGYLLGSVMGAVRVMTTYTKDLGQIKSYLLAEYGFTPEQADKYLEKYCDEYGIPS